MHRLIRSLIDAVTDSFRPQATQATELPIFPLHSVMFPGGLMALRVFEQRYLDMAKACLKHGTPFGIARIREGTEVGTPAIPEAVGTAAEIGEWDMRDLGILQIRAHGRERFRLLAHTVTGSGLLIGTVTMMPDDLSGDCQELAACASFLEKVLTQTQSDHAAGARYDDASWVSFRLTELLPFNETVRQKMLELTDARIRLEILHRFLAKQQLLE